VPHDLVIKNGLVVTPSGVLEGGVAVEGEKIVAVGPASTLGTARREVDVKGKIIFPGVFNPHTHLGNGDDVSWSGMDDDFARDTKDFAIGGITTFATTTVFSKEPMDYCVDRSIKSGTGRSYVDFKITGVILTREHLGEIPAVARKGCVSFKFFTGYCCGQAEALGMPAAGITPDMFFLGCEELAKIGPPGVALIHAEEPYVRAIYAERMQRSGKTDLVSWAHHSPPWAESVQVFQYGVIAKDLGVPMYVVHIANAHTVDFLAWLQSQGYPIIGETVVGFLCTTAEEAEARKLGTHAKIQPPIKFAGDRERLWRGLREGTITVVGTDSISYSSKYKDAQGFWETRVGLNMQEVDTIPLLFTEGVNKGRIDLATLARVLAENPAKTFGLYPQKGVLAPGSDADILVIDQAQRATLGVRRMRGRADYSNWEGKEVKGMPVMTFLRGALIAEGGEVLARPGGRHVVGMMPHGLA
jgi:dihydroorotase-like cyclic amidohydrolase